MARRLGKRPARRPREDFLARRAFLGMAVYAGAGMALARAQGSATCVPTPDAGEGPFYFDPRLVRGDVTDGQPGAPLELALRVERVGDCAALAGVRVDVWHADALGLYSGYERQGGVGGIPTAGVVGKSYLRGTQLTDADGRIAFRTIYPSWYGGRTPHVHFKVLLGGEEVVASQIFFPEDVNDHVFSVWEPYRQHAAKRATRNVDDRLLRDGIFCDAETSDAGVRASAVIAVRGA